MLRYLLTYLLGVAEQTCFVTRTWNHSWAASEVLGPAHTIPNKKQSDELFAENKIQVNMGLELFAKTIPRLTTTQTIKLIILVSTAEIWQSRPVLGAGYSYTPAKEATATAQHSGTYMKQPADTVRVAIGWAGVLLL